MPNRRCKRAIKMAGATKAKNDGESETVRSRSLVGHKSASLGMTTLGRGIVARRFEHESGQAKREPFRQESRRTSPRALRASRMTAKGESETVRSRSLDCAPRPQTTRGNKKARGTPLGMTTITI
jgi:hypothetical protein